MNQKLEMPLALALLMDIIVMAERGQQVVELVGRGDTDLARQVWANEAYRKWLTDRPYTTELEHA